MPTVLIVDAQNLLGMKDKIVPLFSPVQSKIFRISHHKLANIIGNDPLNKRHFIPREPRNQPEKISYFDNLEKYGFILECPSILLQDNDSWDDEKIIQLINKYAEDPLFDTIAIVSGDGGYIEALKNAHDNGKKIIVYSIPECTKNEYIQDPTYNFTNLKNLPELFYEEEDNKYKQLKKLTSVKSQIRIVIKTSCEENCRMASESFRNTLIGSLTVEIAKINKFSFDYEQIEKFDKKIWTNIYIINIILGPLSIHHSYYPALIAKVVSDVASMENYLKLKIENVNVNFRPEYIN